MSGSGLSLSSILQRSNTTSLFGPSMMMIPHHQTHHSFQCLQDIPAFPLISTKPNSDYLSNPKYRGMSPIIGRGKFWIPPQVFHKLRSSRNAFDRRSQFGTSTIDVLGWGNYERKESDIPIYSLSWFHLLIRQQVEVFWIAGDNSVSIIVNTTNKFSTLIEKRAMAD